MKRQHNERGDHALWFCPDCGGPAPAEVFVITGMDQYEHRPVYNWASPNADDHKTWLKHHAASCELTNIIGVGFAQ